MLRQTLFLSLGLLAAVTLGCEKKSETPDAGAVQEEVEDHADHGHDAAHDAAEHAEEAVKEAGEAVEEAAEEVKDAVEDVKLPE